MRRMRCSLSTTSHLRVAVRMLRATMQQRIEFSVQPGTMRGAGRLDSTAKLREPKPPRSLIISTGEDVPRGQSVRARLLILELSKNSIDVGALTARQKDAHEGLYADAMGGFVQWLAGRYDEARAWFDRKISEYRARAMRNTGNERSRARKPDIVANLQAGFELYLRLASRQLRQMRAARRMHRMGGEHAGDALAISEQVLKKRLHERGLLASVDGKRETLTVRRSITGSSKQVLHFTCDSGT